MSRHMTNLFPSNQSPARRMTRRRLTPPITLTGADVSSVASQQHDSYHDESPAGERPPVDEFDSANRHRLQDWWQTDEPDPRRSLANQHGAHACRDYTTQESDTPYIGRQHWLDLGWCLGHGAPKSCTRHRRVPWHCGGSCDASQTREGTGISRRGLVSQGDRQWRQTWASQC